MVQGKPLPYAGRGFALKEGSRYTIFHMQSLPAYTIKQSHRARRVRITVASGQVVVTVPTGTSSALVERWIQEKAEWIRTMVLKTKDTAPVISPKKQYVQYRHRAEAFIVRKVRHWNAIMHCDYTRIVVRNQKTRWGSCSKTGTLSFHYQLFFLPEALADYVVVHELAHLKEMNHSAQFWREVGKILPDFAPRRAALRKFRLR